MYQFDKIKWQKKIQEPLWYMDIPQEMKSLIESKENQELYEQNKEEIYSFFEEQLKLEKIFLDNKDGTFDVERKEIDTVVIHHTHGEKPITKERLSAMELLRLYSTYFANPTYEQDGEIKGKALFSGHKRDNKQVFYPYHWLIRRDGSIERLLYDHEVGWHSGDWNTNCRSIAICLDNNYENDTPSDLELQKIAELIRINYSQIKKEQIFGHREINRKTTCPSNLFLSNQDFIGWKEKLLQLIQNII